MRAIITGATGVVGNALIQELIQNGDEVLVLAQKGSKRNETIPNSPLVSVRFCDLSELATLQNTDSRPFDVFYHLAWDGTVGQARDDMYRQNRNVTYALDAVHTAHRFGCQCFVGAGSQAEYGRVEGILTPDTPTRPEMGYGIGKLCAGLMTRKECHALGMRHIWARILSVYGPYDGMQSVVMSTIESLRRGESPKLTRGEQMWDFLFSYDAARALVLLAERGIDGKTYVLGSGHARPLSEYMAEIRDVVAPSVPLSLGALPYGSGQIMHLEADISALREDLGWEPAHTFRQGIEILMA
ncbi:MAG: NAD(P)-dependent oxidoreductase, partial [Clostridia bacterium]|nr:NAD(P)-dependent oxidoreductase [Clostridia bacterium]